MITEDIYPHCSSSDATKLAIGISEKAYVGGYEIQTLTTTYVDFDKARDFDTENNFSTKFTLGNFTYVKNVYGTPDVGFVSGDVELHLKQLIYLIQHSRGSERFRLVQVSIKLVVLSQEF